MTDSIYINGKIRTITVREDKEYNITSYTVNGKQLSSEKAFIYLNEFQKYPNWILEHYTHPNNNVIIRQFRLVEE